MTLSNEMYPLPRWSEVKQDPSWWVFEWHSWLPGPLVPSSRMMIYQNIFTVFILKLIYSSLFLMYSSVGFEGITMYPPSQLRYRTVVSSTPKISPCANFVVNPSSTPSRGNYYSTFYPWRFAFSRMSNQWNHTLDSIWGLASFTYHNTFGIRPCHYMYC